MHCQRESQLQDRLRVLDSLIEEVKEDLTSKRGDNNHLSKGDFQAILKREMDVRRHEAEQILERQEKEQILMQKELQSKDKVIANKDEVIAKLKEALKASEDEIEALKAEREREKDEIMRKQMEEIQELKEELKQRRNEVINEQQQQQPQQQPALINVQSNYKEINQRLNNLRQKKTQLLETKNYNEDDDLIKTLSNQIDELESVKK